MHRMPRSFKTYRTQFLKQMHQGQHGTEHAEKTLFKKHSHQKTAGEDHGHYRKRERHRIGEIKMEISRMSDKERQNGPCRANLTKRKSPVRMEIEVGNAQRDENQEGQEQIFDRFSRLRVVREMIISRMPSRFRIRVIQS